MINVQFRITLAGAALAMLIAASAVSRAAAPERFDLLVREDFFAGVQGDAARLARGMATTEERLSREPANPEGLVWHGSGLLMQAAAAFARPDIQGGLDLQRRGVAEMDRAVSLAPDRVSVRIPRGATLINASRYMPEDMGRPLLQRGIDDYRRTLELQAPTLSSMSTHARGELLLGLADGLLRLGNGGAARGYFETMAKDPGLADTVYQRKAIAWLDDKPESRTAPFFQCSGCHGDDGR